MVILEISIDRSNPNPINTFSFLPFVRSLFAFRMSSIVLLFHKLHKRHITKAKYRLIQPNCPTT